MPTPKHPLLVNGICRLGRVCYWLGLLLALPLALGGLVEAGVSVQGGHTQNAVATLVFWGVLALIPFSIGRGLRYVLSGE